MIGKVIDITGQRFGRLVVVDASYVDKDKAVHWNCICDCGKSVPTPKTFSLLSGRTKSCGCYQREIMMSRSGENSPKWRGGDWSKKLYANEWTTELKEFIRNRDDRKCQYPNCDYSDVGMSRRLHVHHIDRDKKNCKHYNLISLCNIHHPIVESRHADWIDYFYSITRDYENSSSG